MILKKYIGFLLSCILLLPLLVLPASAADAPEFRYELSVDGSDTVEVNPGDIITVTLYLNRTDADAAYTMYAMQDEIRYDSDFFELVEDSALLSDGIQSTDIKVGENLREFYMNYLSFSGGAQWDARTRIGSFQLRVIATSGVTTITNEDFLVSLKDGSGSYECEANELMVILTTDCTVRFETNGGSKIDPITAIYGETISKPEDPVREGKRFVGWYKDIHLKEAWNFETDTVKGNMTLYAKWEDIPVDPTEPPTTSTEPTEPTVPPTDPTTPTQPTDPTDPTNPIDPTDPTEPTTPTDPTEPVKPTPNSGVYLAVGAGTGILGLLLLLLLLWKRSLVQYSLVTGDVSLYYKNGEVPAEVSVVLYDGEKEYHLNKSGRVEAKHRLRFIRNTTNIAVADIETGTYQGKLLIHEGNDVRAKKCRIKVIDRELDKKPGN